MKIYCLKDSLKRGVDIVERIVGKNLNLPILNNILIETTEGFLKLSSTDLEIGITTQIPAKIEKKGSICLPVKIFNNYISGLPDEKIELELKELSLNIKCDKYKAVIKGQNSQDFPIIPKVKEESKFLLNGSILINGLSRVVEMCSFSDLKPELSGVFFNIKNNMLKLVSTDSFRLAEQIIELKEIKDKTFIVPSRSVQEIIRIFKEDEKIEIIYNQNQISISNHVSEKQKIKTIFVSRLIDGEYPNYEAVIPKNSENEVVVVKNDFLNQIKTASFFSGRINDVKIILNYENQEVEVLSQDPEIGETKSRAKAKIKNNKETEASFNYKFLLNGINNIIGDDLLVEFNGYNGPAVFRGINDKNYIYILMPIKAP